MVARRGMNAVNHVHDQVGLVYLDHMIAISGYDQLAVARQSSQVCLSQAPIFLDNRKGSRKWLAMGDDSYLMRSKAAGLFRASHGHGYELEGGQVVTQSRVLRRAHEPKPKPVKRDPMP